MSQEIILSACAIFEKILVINLPKRDQSLQFSITNKAWNNHPFPVQYSNSPWGIPRWNPITDADNWLPIVCNISYTLAKHRTFTLCLPRSLDQPYEGFQAEYTAYITVQEIQSQP